MFHRVTADILFEEPDEGADFYHDCQLAIARAQTINPGTPTQEKSTIKWQICYHDEDPLKECDLLAEQFTPD